MQRANAWIVEQLRNAPTGQISENVRDKLNAVDLDDNKAVRALLHWIYDQTETERSRFVAAMTDPEFTDAYD